MVCASAQASLAPTGAQYRPYIWHGEILVSDLGHLYSYKVGDGSLAWSHNFPGQLVRGIGIPPDLLYLGTMRGMAYAFSPENC
jgi:hypothetical protein